MANFGGSSNFSRPQQTRAVPVKEDPNKPKTKTVQQALGETAAKAGELADKYTNYQVPLYTPKQVEAQQINAVRMGTPMGAGEMNAAIRAAQGNVGQAGQMDPKVAAYLQAAQQQGQNTGQAMQYLQQAAAGQGPSAAQNQLRAGMDEAIKAQMTAAASRGFSPAAMRGAQMQGADLQQQAANQAAFLRAQEMQAAQAAYAQGALQQEQQARQAALQAGQTTLQQQVASDEARQNAINAYLQGSGQLLNSGTQLATTQAQLDQQRNLANQDAAFRAALFNEQAKMNAAELQQQGQLAYANTGLNALASQTGVYSNMFAQQQQNQREAAARQAAFWQALLGGTLGAAGTLGGAMIMRPTAGAGGVATAGAPISSAGIA